MTDAISQSEYREELEQQAERLASDADAAVDQGMYDEYHQAVYELASEDAEHHNWFARSYYGGSLYGSIIEHSANDPTEYTDWQALIESDTPRQTIKRLAYVVFETDLIVEALSQGE